MTENEARLLVCLLGSRQAAQLAERLGKLVNERAFGEVRLVVHAGTVHTIVTQQQDRFG